MRIAKDKVVTIDYTLRDGEGKVIDTSSDDQPFAYLHGAGCLVPGLEKALDGKQAGDELSISVPPKDAYGDWTDTLLQLIPREEIDVEELEVGMLLQAETEDGMQVVKVSEFNDETVTLDANHPLAGTTLDFDIKIVDVREARLEELVQDPFEEDDEPDPDCN